MIYKNGKKEKDSDCCGMCIHFTSNGITVSEMDSSYKGRPYADTVVGYCPLHEFDPDYCLEGVEHERWETHCPCTDFDDGSEENKR